MKLQHLLTKLFVIIFISSAVHKLSAQTIQGHVSNAKGKPLAFATIKLGDTKQGIIANLDGDFTIQYQKNLAQIEVSYAGYQSKKIVISSTTTYLDIVLELSKAELKEVVISSKGISKVKRIMNSVVANKDLHNPDKYNQYNCHIYYKMAAGISLVDSIRPIKDTSKDARKFREMMTNQHLFVTETKSIRHWKKPQQLQEEVLASRMSGLKTPLFTNIITDVLPFHAYSDFINLNGKDYSSPLSNGLYQRFNFKLADEILQGNDTLWMINFSPKKNQEELRGTLYIHSNGYAIKHLLAYAKDSTLKREFGVEQQYALVDDKWFPQQLNYLINMTMPGDTLKTNLYMKGTSFIYSVKWKDDKPYRFQKAYTVKIMPGAETKTDSAWKDIRPVTLDKKESRTYVFMDSISKEMHFDLYVKYFGKLMEGKLPINMFDLNLGRIYSYNKYEKSRLGLGLQTNEKLSNSFSIGGWAGYGFADKQWKYGAFTEIYLDRFKDHTIKFAYSKDIKDPGRLQINKDLDKNYLRQFLLSRVDNIETYSVSMQNRLGYFTTQIAAAYENIQPQYTYSLNNDSKTFTAFKNYEATFNIRYAFAERRVPAFGRYYNSGTKYPILYGRINTGKITNANITYTQALAAINWSKHINRIGTEKFLLIGAISASNKTLPLSKLFAGNGFLIEKNSLHVFGGMQTMLPYDYYTDKFVNFYWEHSFDFHLYNLKINKSLSSKPSIGLGTNILWGDMKNKEAHQLVAFKVPTKPYTEVGLLLNKLLRLKYLNVYYFTLNIGYFYHFAPENKFNNNARFVFGIGLDL